MSNCNDEGKVADINGTKCIASCLATYELADATTH